MLILVPDYYLGSHHLRLSPDFSTVAFACDSSPKEIQLFCFSCFSVFVVIYIMICLNCSLKSFLQLQYVVLSVTLDLFQQT